MMAIREKVVVFALLSVSLLLLVCTQRYVKTSNIDLQDVTALFTSVGRVFGVSHQQQQHGETSSVYNVMKLGMVKELNTEAEWQQSVLKVRLKNYITCKKSVLFVSKNVVAFF